MFISNCFLEEDVEFVYVQQLVTFDVAFDQCQQLIPQASIPNEGTQNFVYSFVLEVTNGGSQDDQPWFGLRRANDEDLPFGTDLTDPNSFEFLDGTELEDLNNGQFPWRIATHFR